MLKTSFNACARFPILLSASLALVLTTSGAHAQAVAVSDANTAYFDPSDGNQRINLSGRLRMLSQRISGMACNYAADIEPEQSRENLRAAVKEYTTILNGLEHGDPALQIHSPERSLRVLNGVQQVQQQWEPVSALAETVLSGEATEPTVDALAENTTVLLSDAQKLVVQVVDYHYDRVNTIQSVAFTIDFAGRQRMLAQKMSKNICLIHMQEDIGAAMADLNVAYTLFDATLVALQNGMPEVAVNAPPNAEVVEGLDVVAEAWSEISPLVRRALEGERFDIATRTQIFHDLNALTVKMNAAVQMYVTASKNQQI